MGELSSVLILTPSMHPGLGTNSDLTTVGLAFSSCISLRMSSRYGAFS